MENEMLNEVVSEATELAATQQSKPSKSGDLKNIAIIGGVMTLGALAWEFGIKPIGRKVGEAIKKGMKAKEKTEVPIDDEDILDIEEEFLIK